MRKLKKIVKNVFIVLVSIIPMYSTALSEGLEKEFASLEIVTEPPGAQVSVNGTNRGVTPIRIDSLKTDLCDIQLSLEGYNDLFERLDLTFEDYVRVNYKLERKHIENTATINVISSPENALIIIDQDTIGKTPFVLESIKTGIYKLKLIKAEYRPYKEEMNIQDEVTYNVNVEFESKKRNQTIRRISFGALGLVFSGVSAAVIAKAKKEENEKDDAWENFMDPNLSFPEQTRLYEIYKQKVRIANATKTKRNIYIAVASVSCVGFILSIPF